eukprot:CAMPEP_0184307248 /NCGR_PEP_ID=MMETSP1049-20130417/16049_1 /TAXON_ID=77928 /ORGANISM="Proteomonas sulcata, Strain CCMP704" /LENGTH=65 /DNA_ID=CAMNT_0026619703 /DNA_START=29 /DNA_END=226 /DNA_ORIENTATION=+
MLFAVPLSALKGNGNGRGPEWYNNPHSPNNCVGGSETSCPVASEGVVPDPSPWYARGQPEVVAIY